MTATVMTGIGGVLALTPQLEIRMILQQYSVGSEQIDVISAGLVYRFEDG